MYVLSNENQVDGKKTQGFKNYVSLITVRASFSGSNSAKDRNL